MFTFIKAQDDKLTKKPVYTMDSQVDIDGPSEIKLSFFNSIMLQYIKLLFNTSLREFYLNEFSLANKFKLPIEIINNSTPAEISLYYSINGCSMENQLQ